MKSKFFFYIFFVLVFIFMMNAALGATMDNVVAQIPNCYNVSINFRQLSGNHTPTNFVGCTQGIDKSMWYCDCHNILGLYNLTMTTDTALQRVQKYYGIDINYTTYVLTNFFSPLIVEDWGDHIYINGDSPIELEPPIKVIHDTITVYVNQTCDDIKTETVYIDRIVEKFINNTIYEENVTQINLLNDKIVSQDKMLGKYGTSIFWIIVGSIIIIGSMGYKLWRIDGNGI